MVSFASSAPGSAYGTKEQRFSWTGFAWFAALLLLAYAPVLFLLVKHWYVDQDMGHGFFVPVLAGYIAWQKRGELLREGFKPDARGMLLIAWGAVQVYVATLGAELFLARTAFIISLIGVILFLGGTRAVKVLSFPLFLLFFMVPIPAILYTQITFPLQTLASRIAESLLSLLGYPVLREGHVLELASQKLQVVEACSGIRSLLSLSFLSLIYAYFFDQRPWMRGVLLLATMPIAVIANASRVTVTGILSEIRPELAEGFFHSASGWVIFMVAVVLLVAFHQLLDRVLRRASHAR